MGDQRGPHKILQADTRAVGGDTQEAAAEQRRASILADEAVGPPAPPPGPELGVNAGMHQARRYALHRRITITDQSELNALIAQWMVATCTGDVPSLHIIIITTAGDVPRGAADVRAAVARRALDRR